MMRDGAPQTIYRKDYQPYPFQLPSVAMTVEVFDGYTLVDSRLELERVGNGDQPLVLDGEGLELEYIALDDVELTAEDFLYDGQSLTVANAPARCQLHTRVRIHPETNTSLEGLFRSRTMYCTQCEAEGFRKITFFPDRPDVLSTFTVTLEADASSCPVLLSNGNLVSSETIGDGRHRAVWHDPWPKPCYLFAMVAGDLARVEDQFTTASGKSVALHIYVEPKDIDYCDHAMVSLKHSMRWDEETYGLEYDLDLFNIVAVDDFNMGAMENKSLNIFNTSCVLAAPDITTDFGYQRVEAIVAHEYFHNYSGNRVTCRDWFQLSLKEGFTVFRDAEFSADMNSRGVKRVMDVSFLRTHQFAEDAGPMAHPVRPDSFIEISNFYTLTVYEKGAEVVRMLHTLLGHETFIEGAKLYFDRFDGQAVTCDDFVNAMESASGRDLSQFRHWYEQAGTPSITLTETYDPAARRFSLTVAQSNLAKDDRVINPPLHIPLQVALLTDGQQLTLENGQKTVLLELTEAEQTFEFEDVDSEPVVSALRGFSAPVRLSSKDDDATLRQLIAHDDDDYVRWDAFQRYAARVIDAAKEGAAPDDAFFEVFGQALASDTDPAMKAQLLALPLEDYLADRDAAGGGIDVFAIRRARQAVKTAIAERFDAEFKQQYDALCVTAPYAATGDQIAQRSLRHLLLDYRCMVAVDAVADASQLLADADNLTDRLAALRQLINHADSDLAQQALDGFYQRWQHEALVVNQWFSLQAMRPHDDTADAVLKLQTHEAFDWRNPNKVRSLIGGFGGANPVGFHRKDGAGYRLLADAVIRLQASNPQVAARLCAPLSKFRRYSHGQELMRAELERIAATPDLSRDVFEVVERSLAS